MSDRAQDPSALALRTVLVSRCNDSSPPGAWQVAAAAVGVTGADAFLCHLSRSISAALERCAASAAAVRAQLQLARESVLVEDYSSVDKLEAEVTSAEVTKIAALQGELCAVDIALESMRADRGAAAKAAASLGDAELVARHAELTARLDATDARLLALPTSVVEPPYVGLLLDESALRAGVPGSGRVVAPQAITAADLTLEGAPSYAYPGCALRFRLVARGDFPASQLSAELEVSLGAAAAATHAEASLVSEGVALMPLQADVSVDIPGRCIVISTSVSRTSPVGSSVCLGPLTVSGQPVAMLQVVLCVEPPGPADLSPEHAAQLQAWLPRGGSRSPGAWQEVYRATTHGFGAAAFHARCDDRVRLLVLVRAREGGWLFGGFTAIGFSPPERWYSDPSAFLFSLTNTLENPERLDSNEMGEELYYNPSHAAVFGTGADLFICDNAVATPNSYSNTGSAYAQSASLGVHPMAQGLQSGWLAVEVVAWVV